MLVFLIYGTDGTMNLQIANRDGINRDIISNMISYTAHYGTYTFKDSIIQHNIIHNMFPNSSGKTYQQFCTFEEDLNCLTLTSSSDCETMFNGVGRYRWNRVTSHEYKQFVGNWKLHDYTDIQPHSTSTLSGILDGILSLTDTGYIMVQLYKSNRMNCTANKLLLASDDELALCYETCKIYTAKIIDITSMQDITTFQIEILLSCQQEFIGQTLNLQLKQDNQILLLTEYNRTNSIISNSAWKEW